jgi:hypothetical protein
LIVASGAFLRVVGIDELTVEFLFEGVENFGGGGFGLRGR